MSWLTSPIPLPRRVRAPNRGVETHKKLPPLPAIFESSTEEVNQLAQFGTYACLPLTREGLNRSRKNRPPGIMLDMGGGFC